MLGIPGRYGPDGHLCSEVMAALVADYGSGIFFIGSAGGCSSRCVHFVVDRPAGMWTVTWRDSGGHGAYVPDCRKLWIFHCCSSSLVVD